jgi:hypothetical protein
MDPNLHVTIGPPGGEHVTVEPLRRSHLGCTDYWDGNWIACAINVKAGAFRGQVDADLRAEDFVRFRDGLRRLYDELAGNATFATMEDWLAIDVRVDGRGHFEARCELRDDPGMGNLLTFSISFDQTQLPTVLRDLDAVVLRFPVLGRP